MLRVIAAAVLAVAAVSGAHAQTISSNTGSQSQSYSGAQSGVNIRYGDSPRQVGASVPPGLIAGGITCLGSVSIGSGYAGGGLGFGITYPDQYCNIREDAKYMLLVSGNKVAAKERLCDNRRVRHAFAASGDPCIRDRARTQRVAGTTIRHTTSAGYSTSGTPMQRRRLTMRD